MAVNARKYLASLSFSLTKNGGYNPSSDGRLVMVVGSVRLLLESMVAPPFPRSFPHSSAPLYIHTNIHMLSLLRALSLSRSPLII